MCKKGHKLHRIADVLCRLPSTLVCSHLFFCKFLSLVVDIIRGKNDKNRHKEFLGHYIVLELKVKKFLFSMSKLSWILLLLTYFDNFDFALFLTFHSEMI